MTSLGPGSVVKGAGGGGNGVKYEKYRRAKRAQQWPFPIPKLADIYIFLPTPMRSLDPG